MEQRTILRTVIVLAVLVIVVVEGGTLLGLVGQHASDGATTPTPTEQTTASPTSTSTQTVARTTVRPGPTVSLNDDVLADSERTGRLATATLSDGDVTRTLTLTLLVENTGTGPYAVSMGPVILENGSRIPGTVTTGEIAPGEHAPVSGQWTVPNGLRPTAVVVTAGPPGDRTAVEVSFAAELFTGS